MLKVQAALQGGMRRLSRVAATSSGGTIYMLLMFVLAMFMLVWVILKLRG